MIFCSAVIFQVVVMRKEELIDMLRLSPQVDPSPQFSERVMEKIQQLPSHGLQEKVILFYGFALFFLCMGVAMEIGLRLSGLGGFTEFRLRMQPQFFLLNGVWLVVAGVILNMEGYRALKATCVAILVHVVFLSGTAGAVMAISRFFIVPGLFVLALCLGTSLLLVSRHSLKTRSR
jgi:hypothetical protein